MPPRLSELLERIRPAGTPGAPTEGEEQRQQVDRAREVAGIAAVLAAFEQEADAVIAAATTRATKLVHDAEREARQIRAAVPDRMATARAAAVREHQRRDEAEQARLEAQIAAEVAHLESRAAERIPKLVAAASHAVWAIVGDDRRSRGLR